VRIFGSLLNLLFYMTMEVSSEMFYEVSSQIFKEVSSQMF